MKIMRLAGMVLVLLGVSLPAWSYDWSRLVLSDGQRSTATIINTDSGLTDSALNVSSCGALNLALDEDTVGTDSTVSVDVLSCPTSASTVCVTAKSITADTTGTVVTTDHDWLRVSIVAAPGAGATAVVGVRCEQNLVRTGGGSGGAEVLADLTDVSDKQGGGSLVQMAAGGFTDGNCLEFDATGNAVDALAPCGGGGGGGTIELTAGGALVEGQAVVYVAGDFAVAASNATYYPPLGIVTACSNEGGGAEFPCAAGTETVTIATGGLVTINGNYTAGTGYTPGDQLYVTDTAGTVGNVSVGAYVWPVGQLVNVGNPTAKMQVVTSEDPRDNILFKTTGTQTLEISNSGGDTNVTIDGDVVPSGDLVFERGAFDTTLQNLACSNADCTIDFPDTLGAPKTVAYIGHQHSHATDLTLDKTNDAGDPNPASGHYWAAMVTAEDNATNNWNTAGACDGGNALGEERAFYYDTDLGVLAYCKSALAGTFKPVNEVLLAANSFNTSVAMVNDTCLKFGTQSVIAGCLATATNQRDFGRVYTRPVTVTRIILRQIDKRKKAMTDNACQAQFAHTPTPDQFNSGTPVVYHTFDVGADTGRFELEYLITQSGTPANWKVPAGSAIYVRFLDTSGIDCEGAASGAGDYATWFAEIYGVMN